MHPASAADLPFLRDMLFESAFTTDEQRAEWRRHSDLPPELVKYLHDWPRPGDAGFIAHGADGANAGAAWYRIFSQDDRGDGVLALREVPEIAIAVVSTYRGRGVGALLMRALIDAARADGYARLMLSVDPHNAVAIRLYERVGFVRMTTDDAAAGTSWIMVADMA